MNSKRTITIDFFELGVQGEIAHVESHLLNAQLEANDELKRLKKEEAEAAEGEFENYQTYLGYLNHIEDRVYAASEILHVAEEFSLVALYRVLELNTKTSLLKLYDQEEVDSCYASDKLVDLVRQAGVDIPSIDKFRGIDELRKLSNSVKHSGKVSSELADYPEWKEGERLSNLPKAFERLAPCVLPFLLDLRKRLSAL